VLGSASAGDQRFFGSAGPLPLADIAAACGATVARSDLWLRGVAPLQTAGPAQVSFLDNRRYAAALDRTQAGAVIVHPDLAGRVPSGSVALVTPEPYAGWARVAALFHPPPPVRPGIHPTALVDPAARVDGSAEIGPYVVIGAGAEIGPGCRLGPHASIGDGVVVGPECRIGAHVSVSHALLGARVALYPGARIGQDGFGFAVTAEGFVSVPQLGRVLLHDDVEIGANATIDRGSVQDTVIGAGSRIDNLVQIGHNVQVGRCCVIVAQAGISGSTVLEDFVMVGGQSGLTGHLRIGRKARLGAQSGIMADVPAGAEVVGSPSMPVREFFRQVATLRRLSARGARRDGAKAPPGTD
jgi:UDP-3-O-[3-hydroxymyristoyl] glucosamine N-acyltransferase